ncbi:MAG: carbamoyltransferase HypF, partial [Synergistetes bacterium]|nr:carbamoyltransferase HypF [Synergistota bacterium]
MKRTRIKVYGVVQGVGFRPFVLKLARSLCLGGWVKNTSECVEIELLGEESRIREFIKKLRTSHPPLARIVNIEITSDEEYAKEIIDFRILKSERKISSRKEDLWIPPDVGTCDDCLRELFDPKDRRYRYPFINCTNCGPRFTIIISLPYDREKTTMKAFKMCEKCQSEYDNPDDRRFHAQPNACPVCGPRLKLLDRYGRVIPGDALENAIKILKEGKILAVKGLGGFHLAVDALNAKAIEELRRRKRRPHKPFALMAFNLERISKFAFLSEREKEDISSPIKPILILRKKKTSILPEVIAPNNKYLGFMLPYTPLHYLLTEKFEALIMTSGNLSDEPIIY